MQNEEKGNHQRVCGRWSGTEANADASTQDSSFSRQPGPGGRAPVTAGGHDVTGAPPTRAVSEELRAGRVSKTLRES